MPSNLQRTTRIARLSITLAGHQLRGNRRQLSQALFDAMIELGGVYVKFLQALIIRSDIFTDQSLSHQIRVYENVEPETIDLPATLAREIGPHWRQQFESIDTMPFAAGSFGQVYRARLIGGGDVIIKVLRPSLTKTLRYDLRLLGVIVNIASIVKSDSMMDLKTIYQDFRDVTASEVNYKREAAFAAELYERYKDHTVITIPLTHLPLSSANVIVQEYMGGISLSQVIAAGGDAQQYVAKMLGSDLRTQLEEVGFEFLRSMFAYPTGQGDPHPGNIKLLPGNRVGLIDFGMITDAPKDRASLFALVKEYAKIYNGVLDVRSLSEALLHMFASKLVTSIYTLGDTARRPGRSRAIMDEVTKAAEARMNSGRTTQLEELIGSGRFMLAFMLVINENNRFGLQLQTDATTFIRSSNMFINMVNSLGLRTQVMQPIYNRVVAEIEANHSYAIATRPAQMSHETAMEVVSDWMERVAVSDPLLFNRMQSHLRRPRYV